MVFFKSWAVSAGEQNSSAKLCIKLSWYLVLVPVSFSYTHSLDIRETQILDAQVYWQNVRGKELTCILLSLPARAAPSMR